MKTNSAEKNKEMVENITILGAGTWGATLGVLLCEKGYNVTIWEIDARKCSDLSFSRKIIFLPHLSIPEKVTITGDISSAVYSANMLVFAVPSQTLRATAKLVRKQKLAKAPILVIASKGLEMNSALRLSEVLEEELRSIGRKNIAVLSGPTHAEELSAKMSTAIVAASTCEKTAKTVQRVFSTPYLRVYTNKDITGVELGGALKNIIAIAVGIADGLGFGDNAKAALITRGAHEIMLLGKTLGAKSLTFSGLSGIGDLIVTCISRNSRNRNFGEKIGRGLSIEQALKEVNMVVEGISTTKAVKKLSSRLKLKMPITEEVYNVLFKGKNPAEAEKNLMKRAMKSEYGGLT